MFNKYRLKHLWLKKDKPAFQQWQNLMQSANLQSKEVLDYTIGVYDGATLAATASLAGNTIRCVAVDAQYRSENLLDILLTHLMNVLRRNNQFHFFLYTKPENYDLFHSFGFKKVIANPQVLFMEHGEPDFNDYLNYLQQNKKGSSVSAVVMNANPFTKGHQHLVETAAKNSQHVYVFVVSEEKSEFSREDRLKMVELGTAHLVNVTILSTREYLVSSSTFPTYFLKEQAPLAVAKVQAELDAYLFKEMIAKKLGIKQRFVGEEPFSHVTEVYNQEMAKVFGDELKLTVIPRLTINQEIISATKVRQAILAKDTAQIKQFLPETSYNYLMEKDNLMR